MSRPRKKIPSKSAAEQRRSASRDSRATTLIVAAALALVTAVTYAQVGGFPFIDSFDDSTYVTGNAHVLTGLQPQNIGWALTGFCAGNWHPLTMLSHMTDCQLFGVAPGPAHLVNLLFHITNVLLLFLGLSTLTGALWSSAFAAGLFALHPLHVESVAWIAERKDVLSTFFLLSTIGAYVRYVRRPEWRAYVVTIVLFALGLMAKPMLVTLPFALVLLDAWPLGRLAGSTGPQRSMPPLTLLQSLREKIPMMLLALGAIALTLRAQAAAGASAANVVLPLSMRLGNAALASVGYIGKLFLPLHLACLYPYPASINAPLAIAAAALLAAVTVAVILLRRRSPYATAGWLWYMGTLVPVIGIIQVGNQAMADRYTYVPFIGLTVAIVWSCAELAAKFNLPRPLLAAAAGAILLASAFGTSRQLAYWGDPATLFRRCIEVTPRNSIAHNNYGLDLLRLGDNAEAREQFEQALTIDPRHIAAWSNLGIAWSGAGRHDEAVKTLERGLVLAPRDLQMNYNLAVELAQLKRYPESFGHFETAYRGAPENPETQRSYSIALEEYGDMIAKSGQDAEAQKYFHEAVRICPANVEAQKRLEPERAAPHAAGSDSP